MVPTSKPRAPSLATRLSARFGYVLFLALVLEAGSFFAFRIVSGEFYSSTRIREQQSHVAESVLEDGSGNVLGQAFLRHEALHPYLGYVPVHDPAEAIDGLLLNQGELFEPDSVLFERASDTVLVALTGGSVAAQFGQKGLVTLERELARVPRFADKDLQFIGLAAGGYKQPQQLMAVAYLLALGGSIDVVINIDGFNEVALHQHENADQGVFFAYPREWYFRAPPDNLALPLVGEIAYRRRARARAARDAMASPLRASWTYRLLWKLRDRSANSELVELENALRDYVPGGEASILLGPRREFANDGELFEAMVAVWRASSLQLDGLCRSHGAEYYHVLQPNQYVANSKPLSPTELADAYRPELEYSRGAAAGYPLLIEAGARLRADGVRFLDATGVFEGLDETLYVDTCCHFNRRGNEVLAEAVARFISVADGARSPR